MHSLLATFQDAAAGRFPDVDGGVTHLPPLGDGQEAVDGLFTLGMGLGGRQAMSVENSVSGPLGRDLIEQALAITWKELVFAAVAPGNPRSLRSFLSCGFVPIGSEVLIRVGGLGKEKEGQVV